MVKEMRARQRRLLVGFVTVIVVELVLLGLALVARPAVQAIPGRYRSRLPVAVQRLAHQPHAYLLPTPDILVTAALPTFPVTPPSPTPTAAPPTRTPVARPPTRQDMTATPSRTPIATRTPSPTPTVTTVRDPALIARSTPADLERAFLTLAGVTHSYQLWNNCGPATLTMALSYYGWQGDQRVAAAFLKPDQEDKNVNPSEMAAFVQQQGLEVIVRYGGDVQLIRQLLLAGFPVLIEKGFDPEPDRLGWMGHYLLIVGYNEFEKSFVTMDSYLGPDRKESYTETDEYWRHFNRTYLVIFRPEQRADLAAVLGDDMAPTVNAWNTLSVNIAEVRAMPADAFAWFNLGTSYAQVGFYPDAAGAYDEARRLGLPWRMLWYQFGPFESYLQVGRVDDVLTLAEATLATTREVEEAFYYRGVALKTKGDLVRAREAFEQAVSLNPNFAAGVQALAALPPVGG